MHTKGKGSKNKARPNKTVHKETALAVSKPMDGLAQTYEQGMPRAATLTADLFQQLSALAALSSATPRQLSDLHDYISKTFTSEKAAVNDIAAVVKARTRALLKSLTPMEVLPSGTRRWNLDGRIKEIRIQKHGLDPKLVEAQLRNRKLTLEKYMNPTTSYKLKDDTEKLLKEDLIFTEDELATMKFKPEDHEALYPSTAADKGGGS